MQTFRVSNLVSGRVVAQIGRICVHWSGMELTMERLIWHLSGLPPKEGRKVTSRLNIDPRIKRLKKLSREHLSENQKEEIYQICRSIKAVQNERNWAVHGLYGIDRNGKRHTISYRDDQRGIARPVSETSLREVRKEIFRLQNRLEAFLPLPRSAGRA